MPGRGMGHPLLLLLGLALASRVAELHGGSLVLSESEGGRPGFLLSIPMLSPAAPDSPGAP
jgi:signal transduction histidine kinase